jgi:hypothetical protein
MAHQRRYTTFAPSGEPTERRSNPIPQLPRPVHAAWLAAIVRWLRLLSEMLYRCSAR